MSVIGNFITLLDIGLALLGGALAALSILSVFGVFISNQPSQSRLFATIVSIYVFIFALPITLTMAGLTKVGVGTAIGHKAFYQFYPFGFGAAFLLAGLTTNLAAKLRWVRATPLVPQSGLVTFLEISLNTIGGAGLGYLLWPQWGLAVGWLFGLIVSLCEYAAYNREIEQAAPPQAATSARVEYIPPPATKLIDMTPNPSRPPLSAHGVPPKDIGAGFDVPPQN